MPHEGIEIGHLCEGLDGRRAATDDVPLLCGNSGAGLIDAGVASSTIRSYSRSKNLDGPLLATRIKIGYPCSATSQPRWIGPRIASAAP